MFKWIISIWFAWPSPVTMDFLLCTVRKKSIIH